ncbi:MAG: HAMP domain-containing histidine kinase, partial [Anaerolineae bacterium]|nr:HAMP domain-containing histidine kinase [Anaerolineae bacterium]
VRLTDDASSAVLSVADTGIGIPEESIAKIGDEFFRAGNAREAGIMGTGLGLATVKQLVANFGGLMRIESTVGKGTTFTVTLPVVVPDGTEKAEAV